MEVEVTHEAGSLIRRSTGELYLWQTPVGQAFARDKLSMRRPDSSDLAFAPCYRDARVTVFLERDAPRPAERLLIDCRGFWPFRRVRAQIDGRTWGKRGVVDGGGG